LLDEWLTIALKRGLLFEHGKKAPIFFAHDPVATLDRVITAKLGGAPLSKTQLTDLVAREAPGHEQLFDHWLASAVKRGLLFKYANEQFGTEPDIQTGLKAVFAALTKALASDPMKGVSKQRIANAVLAELGLPQVETSAFSTLSSDSRLPDMRNEFVGALRQLVSENPNRPLQSIYELRARLDIGKELFDTIALELARDGVVGLHHHDHPHSLPEAERAALIRDARGTHYLAIELRSA